MIKERMAWIITMNVHKSGKPIQCFPMKGYAIKCCSFIGFLHCHLYCLVTAHTFLKRRVNRGLIGHIGSDMCIFFASNAFILRTFTSVLSFVLLPRLTKHFLHFRPDECCLIQLSIVHRHSQLGILCDIGIWAQLGCKNLGWRLRHALEQLCELLNSVNVLTRLTGWLAVLCVRLTFSSIMCASESSITWSLAVFSYPYTLSCNPTANPFERWGSLFVTCCSVSVKLAFTSLYSSFYRN